MPTFDDPIPDAGEASQALRGLAHATIRMDQPADTYRVLGDLLSGVRSLHQVLDQLAATHLRHRAVAHDDNGNRAAGGRFASAAADELRQAGSLLGQVEFRLDEALQHSSRIAWHETPSAPSPEQERLHARLSGFAEPFAAPSAGHGREGVGGPSL